MSNKLESDHDIATTIMRETEDRLIRDLINSSSSSLATPSREDVLYGLERLKRRLNFMHGQELKDFLEGNALEIPITPWDKTTDKKNLNVRIT